MVILIGLSKLEVRVLTIAAVGLTFCGFLLSSEMAFQRLLRPLESRAVPSVKMARAENVVGQVYIKPAGQEQPLLVESGQALFVGERFRVSQDGRLSVRLLSGLRVFALSGAFFRLDQFAEGNLVSLDRGGFRVQLDGEFLAAIDGEPVRLSGQAAEIEIQIGDNGSFTSQVLSGEGHVAKLKNGNFEVPLITEGDPLHIYVWKFADLYENRKNEVRRRAEPVREVNFSRDLLWDHAESGPFSVQIAGDENFREGRRFFTSADKRLSLEKVSLGETFWRVSFDQRRWSSVGRFELEGRYLDARCDLRISRRAGQTYEFELSSPSEQIRSYVIEVSPNPSFSAADTEVRISETRRFVYGFTKPGRHFVRARAVNGNQEISESSPVLVIKSTSP